MWPAPPDTTSRWHRLLILLAPALVYFGVRATGLAILAVLADANGTTARRALTSWDGQWYLGIAFGGYDNAPDWMTDAAGVRTAETPLAFFPGYPKPVGALSELPFATLGGAAFTVTALFGLLAAYGLAGIGVLVRGGSRRAGLALVALFAASPMAVVLSMTYSEAMFCALAAWTLVFVLLARRTTGAGPRVAVYWAAAGACCALAGLVRPTAAALVFVVLPAAVIAMWGTWWARGGAALAVVLAPAGLLGYLFWVGSKVRPNAGVLERLGAWSAVQERGWGSVFDGGAQTVQYSAKALLHSPAVAQVGTVAVLLAAIVLAVIGVARRVEWPLPAYGLGVLALCVGSSGLMTSKARLLLPAFTLLVPVAMGLARRRGATMVLVLVGAAVVSGWYGAHSLVVWEYAP